MIMKKPTSSALMYQKSADGSPAESTEKRKASTHLQSNSRCMQSDGRCMQSGGRCMQADGRCMQADGRCMQADGRLKASTHPPVITMKVVRHAGPK